eukprot:g4967.t1
MCSLCVGNLTDPVNYNKCADAVYCGRRSADGIEASKACCACSGGVDKFLADGAEKPLAARLEYAAGQRLTIGKTDKAGFKGIADLIQLGTKATPFDISTVSTTQDPRDTPNVRMETSSIQTQTDFKEAVTVAASIQGSYGAFTGSASATASTETTLTSKSSAYMLYYDAAFPAVMLDEEKTKLSDAALKDLKEDPVEFKNKYGQHYIAGYIPGCQSTVRVLVTAKSDAEKSALDAKAAASYGSIASGSGEFTKQVEESESHSSTTITITNVGTKNLPASLADTTKVQEGVVQPLLDGTGCTKDSSEVLRVIVLPLLSNPEVAANASPEAQAVLTPSGIYAKDLSTLNTLNMQVQAYKSHAKKCQNDVFSCTTQAWLEPQAARQELYEKAYSGLLSLEDELNHLTESSLILDPSAMLTREIRLNDLYKNFLRPASLMRTLTFTFSGWMTSCWDDPEYTRDGAPTFSVVLKVDPNRVQTRTKPTTVETDLDNGHGWPRHITGAFRAQFLDGSIQVQQDWDRHSPFGTSGTNDWLTIRPGESQSNLIQSGLDDAKADYSFKVEYGDPFADDQNPTN